MSGEVVLSMRTSDTALFYMLKNRMEMRESRTTYLMPAKTIENRLVQIDINYIKNEKEFLRPLRRAFPSCSPSA